MLIHVSKPVHELPRRYRVEFQPVERVCVVAAAAIALGVALVAVATISAAAPPVPHVVTRNVTFRSVLRPADVASWMRAPADVIQPDWVR